MATVKTVQVPIKLECEYHRRHNAFEVFNQVLGSVGWHNLGNTVRGVVDGKVTLYAKNKIDALLKTAFNSEFLNRLGSITTFKPLSENKIGQIIDLMLKNLKNRLSEKRVDLIVTDAAKNYIIGSDYDMVFGERPLKRFIEQNIETMIAKEIIAGNILPDTTVTIDTGESGLSIRN